MIMMILVSLLFIILGIVFINGKGAFLIAGYNTMPQEEKEKYNEVALAKFMGKMMFALSFSMIFLVLSELYNRSLFFFLGLSLFISIIIFTLVYMNTQNRFKI